jgi:hypothetical protein
LPPSMERLWLGELRRAHAIINIISIEMYRGRPPQCGRSRPRAARPALPRKYTKTTHDSQLASLQAPP